MGKPKRGKRGKKQPQVQNLNKESENGPHEVQETKAAAADNQPPADNMDSEPGPGVSTPQKVEVNNVDAKPPLPPSARQAELVKVPASESPPPEQPVKEQSTVPAPLPQAVEPPKTPEPETVEEKREPVEQVDISVEDKKVAERNEKNEAQQRQMPAQNSVEDKANDEPESVITKEKRELKYSYREDQWSPINPQGKKQYDRKFLLGMQYAAECLEKPAGLPWLPDVILDQPITNKGDNRPMQFKGVPDFTPGFVKSPNAKVPMNRRNSAQKGGMRPGPGIMTGPPTKVINIQLQQDVQLHTTENAWKPGRKADKIDDEEALATEELYKKVKSILNKLTPQKFDKLSQQIMDLTINTEERLKGVIDIIFEKAISEPSFSKAYAQLCKLMLTIKVPQDANKNESVVFRVLLLNRCQREFEKDKAVELELAQKQKEIDEATAEKKEELKKKKVPTATLR